MPAPDLSFVASPFRAMVLVAAACISSFLLAPAPAQPPTPAVPPTPSDLLAAVVAHYRAGPTCERIRIEVRSDSGRTARSWAVVRLFPAPESASRIALELGPLRLAADGRTLSAVHARNPLIHFTTTIPGEGPLTTARLLQALPPIPLPQLDLIQAEDPAHLALLTPYARSVTWSVAAPDPRVQGGGRRFTLTGASDRGPVTLTVRNGQIQSLDLRDDSRGITVRLVHSPIIPCRAEDAAIDTAGRTSVAALAELQPRSGVLRPGSPIPDMQLSTTAGQVQRLKDLFTPPAVFLPAPEVERLVLIFVRYPKDPLAAAPAIGRVNLSELAQALAHTQREAFEPPPPAPLSRAPNIPLAEHEPALVPTFNYAQVMVLDSPPPAADALLTLIKREQRAWSGVPRRDDAAAAGDHLAWTTDARSSIDLFGASAESLAVILDAKQQLRSVIMISARTTTEELLDQITVTLMEASE